MAQEEHVWDCKLYEFQMRSKADETANNICRPLSQDSVGVRKCQHWFKKFREENFSLNDGNDWGRIPNFDQEAFQFSWLEILK